MKNESTRGGIEPGPSKHRLQSSCFIHYAMTPSLNRLIAYVEKIPLEVVI